MHDALLMDGVKAGRYAFKDSQGLWDGKAALPAQRVAQRLATDVLHDDDQVAVLRSEVTTSYTETRLR